MLSEILTKLTPIELIIYLIMPGLYLHKLLMEIHPTKELNSNDNYVELALNGFIVFILIILQDYICKIHVYSQLVNSKYFKDIDFNIIDVFIKIFIMYTVPNVLVYRYKKRFVNNLNNGGYNSKLKTAWESYFYENLDDVYMIIKLKNDSTIFGYYANIGYVKSYVSTAEQFRDIYIAEIFTDETFKTPASQYGSGVWINNDEISTIQILRVKDYEQT